MSNESLSSVGEFGFIERIKKICPLQSKVIYGIGDDAAVLPFSKTMYQLCAIDSTIENVHFTSKKHTARQIGHKALARNISDIAAMGGFPTHAVVAISLPKGCSLSYVTNIYRGIAHCARSFNMSIVGGDTSQAPWIHISIAIFGLVEKKNLIRRDGAKSNDAIYVTGTFGASGEKKHISFTPRLTEARFLAQEGCANALIDVSDGLVQDLGHILKASKKGARLDLEKIPVSAAAKAHRGEKTKKAYQAALYDGEDFELLFTVSPKREEKLKRRWKQKIKTKITRIGSITSKKELLLQTRTGVQSIEKKGYMHF